MVKIIADTTSCLSESFASHHYIPIIPQVISFGEESYLEGLQISYESFMHRLQTSKDLLKTAAPPSELFTEAFKRFAPDGESILCILPSAAMSGTVRSATVGLQKAKGQGIDGLDEIPILAVPPAVVTHGGPGVLDVGFFTE